MSVKIKKLHLENRIARLSSRQKDNYKIICKLCRQLAKI